MRYCSAFKLPLYTPLKKAVIFLFISALACSHFSCDVDAVSNTDETVPEVFIVYPPDHSVHDAEKPVAVVLTASNEELIEKVELYLNGGLISEIAAPPFRTFINRAMSSEENTLFAKAYSGANQQSNSNIVRFAFSQTDTTETAPPVLEGMAFVEGGSFIMGCENEKVYQCTEDSRPSRMVGVSSFYIRETEITNDEYAAIMNTTLQNAAADAPVRVSWYDAVKFCNRLSILEGLTVCYSGDLNQVHCDFEADGYRLPTEAEWEFAAKGGNTSTGHRYSGSNDLESVGWYAGNVTGIPGPQPVKQLAPNELGIFDMSGNLDEWCWDWYGEYPELDNQDPVGPASGVSKVSRGGSFFNRNTNCQTISRGSANPSVRGPETGFRIVRKVR